MSSEHGVVARTSGMGLRGGKLMGDRAGSGSMISTPDCWISDDKFCGVTAITSSNGVPGPGVELQSMHQCYRNGEQLEAAWSRQFQYRRLLNLLKATLVPAVQALP